MPIVARMQLAMAVIEQFGFESVGNVTITEGRVEILIHENAEFYKAAPNFKEEPVTRGHSSIVARMTAEVNGVLLLAYKHADEVSVAS